MGEEEKLFCPDWLITNPLVVNAGQNSVLVFDSSVGGLATLYVRQFFNICLQLNN